MRVAILLAFCCPVLGARSQAVGPIIGDPPHKELQAVRTAEAITIDGTFDERAWAEAPFADGFTQYEPVPNTPATFQSSVRVLYDDRALYIAAELSDPAVDSLMLQLSQRDEFAITDYFSVVIDPYRSGLNGFGFSVSSANVQLDLVYANDEEDETWNAVWQSETSLTPTGWLVEMKVPFSAIRFPDRDVQEWNINFLRHVGRKREKSFWAPVDPNKAGFLNQCGACNGITAVRSPLRLMLYPYASAYLQHYPANGEGSDWSRSFNGGMDVKLGLSDAFTLDMTLVPDFGQVVSDNVVLNLSPFEVQYNERRQFFTEGTELFQRGGLFYSRRIGGEPLLRDALYTSLAPGETVTEDPGTSKLINATKVSGRASKGLGLGMLNAVTQATYATVRDSSGNTREVLTDPLTNYNVLVVDQLLHNNGYVSLINTNVLRDGATYDANASAVDFLINNRKRSLQAGGTARVVRRFGPGVEQDAGNSWTATINKTGGAWNYGLEYNDVSPDFDPNDLGFWQFVNYRGVEPEVTYTNFKPRGKWMKWQVGFQGEYLRVVQPDHFFNFAVEVNTFRISRKFDGFGGHVRAEPVVTYDPFEARVPGRLYEFPTNIQGYLFISSNYNKPFALDADVIYRLFNDADRRILRTTIGPRFRPNDRLFFVVTGGHEVKFDDVGWVAFAGEDIIMGRRDLRTDELGLEGRYIFNNRMSLGANVRHYWSRAIYTGFNRLEENGKLVGTDYTGLDDDGQPLHDVDFDAFTVDLLFRWNFAPGSELTLGWKDNIYTSDRAIATNYFDDVRNTWAAPGINSLSLKVLYFIDAQSFRVKANGGGMLR